MSKYESLDTTILEAIGSGTNTALQMDHSSRLQALTNPHVSVRTPHFRIIDRRLQALRKAGRIMYQSKRWSVV